jgi:hypothetical protein
VVDSVKVSARRRSRRSHRSTKNSW